MKVGTHDFYADIAEQLDELGVNFALVVSDKETPEGVSLYSNLHDQQSVAACLRLLTHYGCRLPPNESDDSEEAPSA